MTQPTGHSRVCPTRIDGRTALFAHKLTVDQCEDRQRGRYHKCYSCAYAHAYVALHGLPVALTPVPRPSTPDPRIEPATEIVDAGKPSEVPSDDAPRQEAEQQTEEPVKVP